MKILFGFFVGLIAVGSLVFFLTKPQKPLNIVPGPVNTSPTATPFSLKNAPSQSLKGKLHIIADDVIFEDRVASEAAKITEDMSLQQGEHIETGNTGRAKIFFDPVAIDIFPESAIDIVQTLPVNLVFNFLKGRISIERFSDKTVSVRTKHLLIDITGKADIEIDKDKPLISINVSSGSAVLAYNNLKYETQSLQLSKGQSLIYNDATRKVSFR